jgi:hypothetical protein
MRAFYICILGSGVAQSVQCLGYRLDDRRSIPGRGREQIFSHSPPSSAKVKNLWRYT